MNFSTLQCNIHINIIIKITFETSNEISKSKLKCETSKLWNKTKNDINELIIITKQTNKYPKNK
jgi:hypothetical protein